MSKLLSTCILFRHGARGPGDSETSAWAEGDTVVTQWEEHECENLSSTGVQQLRDLGRWFAKKYILDGKLIKEPKPFFRGSKSDRAVESGRDFVTSFNETLSFECCPEIPQPFSENADCYFRPWKVHTESGKVIKAKMKNDEWAEKAEENKDFLAKVRTDLQMKSEYGENLTKALWSITHIAGLVECETHWPVSGRTALVSRLSPTDYPRIVELACWVWEQRFLKSGFEHLLGGWVFLDMIMRTFDSNFNISMFSGHDYTILALLAIDPSLMPHLSRPIEFGSHIIFELWDGVPPTPETVAEAVYGTIFSSVNSLVGVLQDSLCSMSGSLSMVGEADSVVPDEASSVPKPLKDRVLRIILNQQPFERRTDLFGVDSPRVGGPGLVETVRDDRGKVIADLNMTQVKALVDSVVLGLSSLPGGLPSHFEMPQFE